MKNKLHVLFALLAIVILLVGIIAFDKNSSVRMSVMFCGVVIGITACILKLISMLKR